MTISLDRYRCPLPQSIVWSFDVGPLAQKKSPPQSFGAAGGNYRLAESYFNAFCGGAISILMT
jgi:hypothetical protein